MCGAHASDGSNLHISIPANECLEGTGGKNCQHTLHGEEEEGGRDCKRGGELEKDGEGERRGKEHAHACAHAEKGSVPTANHLTPTTRKAEEGEYSRNRRVNSENHSPRR